MLTPLSSATPRSGSRLGGERAGLVDGLLAMIAQKQAASPKAG